MRICRFDDNRVGVVEGDEIVDVSAIVDRLPACEMALPSWRRIHR
ncbi:hypothetical protein EV132_13311 [Rhizobium sullae]|uniref:Uncharacterized protein n=1 Tax=Rhizobium sullae TaxID=50338 RepID=A0A4R3PT88_RHISU|nr:hypothetical protein EV132_13311 [Rhizobium sullae]